MSHYTVDLRNLINIYGYTRQEIEGWFSSYELSDYLTQSQIETINENGTWSKEKLARKIVDFYLMREIGLETPALFEHYAKITMERIMEKYLPVIYSNSLSYDILKNENITETINRERSEEGTNTGTSTSSSSGLTVNSDTPQRSNIKRIHSCTDNMLQVLLQEKMREKQVHHQVVKHQVVKAFHVHLLEKTQENLIKN